MHNFQSYNTNKKHQFQKNTLQIVLCILKSTIKNKNHSVIVANRSVSRKPLCAHHIKISQRLHMGTQSAGQQYDQPHEDLTNKHHVPEISTNYPQLIGFTSYHQWVRRFNPNKWWYVPFSQCAPSASRALHRPQSHGCTQVQLDPAITSEKQVTTCWKTHGPKLTNSGQC